MARQVRIELPGAFYHVMARGNHFGICTQSGGVDHQPGLKHFRIKKGAKDALGALDRGDLRAVVIAWSVRKKTSLSLRWIADRFAMKTPSNVSQGVRNIELTPCKKLALELQKWREMNEICYEISQAQSPQIHISVSMASHGRLIVVWLQCAGGLAWRQDATATAELTPDS